MPFSIWLMNCTGSIEMTDEFTQAVAELDSPVARMLEEKDAEIESLRAEIKHLEDRATEEIESLEAEIEHLKAELAAETQRRWDGNRIASDEAAEEALARKELREQLMDAAGRTGDDVVMARLIRMAEEIK